MPKRLKTSLSSCGKNLNLRIYSAYFPYMLYQEKRMDHLPHELKESGVGEVFFEGINRRTTMVKRNHKDRAIFEEKGHANVSAQNKVTDEQVVQMA